MHTLTITVPTDNKDCMVNITAQVKGFISGSGAKNGLVHIFCPHTTAGITINENADPDVVTDFLLGMRTAFPENAAYRHDEGNTTAHLKASSVGSSATVPLVEGVMALGIWQGIYLCEFDGPRTRRVVISVLEG